MQDTIPFKSLKKGDIVLLDDPVRLAKVVGPAEVEVLSADGRERVRRDAVEVLVTIPDFAIPGLIAKGQAAANAQIKKGIDPDNPAQAANIERVWTEIWSERSVPKVDIAPGSLPKIYDKQFEFQTYVAEERGRAALQMGSGPVTNHRVSGVVLAKDVAAKCVPADCFKIEEPASADAQ